MTLHKEITIHPGVLLLDGYIKPSGLTLGETAKKLNMSTAQLSRLTTGKSSLTIDVAIMLEKVFKRTAKGWMVLQINYDLANRGHIYG